MGLGISLCFCALVWRLFSIQVLDHKKYAEQGAAMRRSTEQVLGYAGTIHLRDRVIVARDVVDYEIGVDPKRLSSEKITEIVRLVCGAIDKPPEYRRQRLLTALERKDQGGEYVHLASGVSDAVVQEIRDALERTLSKEERKSLVVTPRARRSYPRGTLASSVVGVTDQAGSGFEGVERSLQAYLSRRDGRREVVRDATQRTRIYRHGATDVMAVGGYDVYLTIDSRIQAIVESELDAGIAREKAEAGLLVLMDPNTGDVLAMASRPAYDPNHYSDYPEVERAQRRTNRVVENMYEPGSVIKPFLAAYVLDRRIGRRDQLMRELISGPVTWDGGRRARFGRRAVTDVHEYPDLTLERAVVHSSNICMSILGLRLGRPGIMEMLTSFGFCEETGIDLPFEAPGKYTPAEKWNVIYTPVSVSFGYEVMVTPLQLCRAFACLVNGGYLLKPRIVDRVCRDGEEQVFPARQIVGQPISAETSRNMREILRLVVEEGTARWLKIEGFDFGAKTGTADMARGGYFRKDYLASFEAFAPSENPKVVALCMIEKPRGSSYYGAMVAGPIVVEVFRRMFHVAGETRLALVTRGGAR